MLPGSPTPKEKIRQLRSLLKQTGLMVPGCFNAISAQLIEQAGFPVAYVSGAGLSNGVTGYPDIGLLSFDEMARQAGYIARSVHIPVFADADHGYGDAWQVYRTVQAYEREGLAGLHLEDQETSKRCGHLAGKQVISTARMVEKIRAACDARQNPDFLIIARTDAVAVEGLESALKRLHAYVSAGADMIFPEALTSSDMFQMVRQVMPNIPLLANMTEFGQTPIISADDFASWGYQWVLYPMTLFRGMMFHMSQALQTLKQERTQTGLLNHMTSRQALYDVLRYEAYNQQDSQWFEGFKK